MKTFITGGCGTSHCEPYVISTLRQNGKFVSCWCVLDDAKWCREVLKGAQAKLAKGYKMFTVQGMLE